MLPVNLKLIAAAASLVIAAASGAWVGYKVCNEKHLAAAEARVTKQDTRRAFSATRIVEIQKQGASVRERIVRERVEVPIYDECRVPAIGMRLVNEARTGKPSDYGFMPGTEGSDR